MESKSKGSKAVIKVNIKPDSYYKRELNKLTWDSLFAGSIQVLDGEGNKTKYLSLNEECISEVICYLEGLREELKKDKD